MRILAVDYGERFSGLAYSPDGIVALPLTAIDTKELSDQISLTIELKKIQQIVVGLPKMDNGQNTALTEIIQVFFKENHFGAPVEFINERGSTKFALKSTSSGRVDDIAAQQILTYYLDKKQAR